MGRDIDLTDKGAVILREDVANGVAAITVDAPADLTGAAGSYAMELLDQLPAGLEFLQINAAGKWTTNSGSAGSLDAAYDSGGAGAGRVIVADNGAVEVQGAGGIHINTDGDGVPALLAIQSDALFDAVITFVEDSNQKFELGYDQSRGGLVIGLVDFTAPAFFMEDITADVGFNETDPAARVHITDTAQTNLIVERLNNPICRIALRDSATGGFGVVGIQSNADNLQLVAGSTILVHVDGSGRTSLGGDVDPDAATVPGHVAIITDSSLGVALFLHGTGGSDVLNILSAGSGRGAVIDSATAATAFQVNATGSGRAAFFQKSAGGTNPVVHIQASGGQTIDVLQLFQLSTGADIPALFIDSRSLDSPLIDLVQVVGNARGDLAFGAVRTADASAPDPGDLWYDGTGQRMAVKGGGGIGNLVVASRYGPSFGVIGTVAISAGGVLTISRGYIKVAANSGTADDLDTITSASPVALVGETILLTADGGDTITVTQNGNVILVGASRVLGTVDGEDLMMLVKLTDGPETWGEISYANNS